MGVIFNTFGWFCVKTEDCDDDEVNNHKID